MKNGILNRIYLILEDIKKKYVSFQKKVLANLNLKSIQIYKQKIKFFNFKQVKLILNSLTIKLSKRINQDLKSTLMSFNIKYDHCNYISKNNII